MGRRGEGPRERDSLSSDQLRIVRWIREEHSRGMPLNVTAVRRRVPEVVEKVFLIRPFWGWRRAIEAAGLTYDDLAFELEAKVECRICGHRRASLIAHFWRQHEISGKEYQAEFPGAEIVSEAVRARIRRPSTGATLPHWEPVWSHEYLLDRVSRYGDLGVPLNLKSIDRTDPALVGMAMLRFGHWDDVLRAVGLDPDAVRLNQRALKLTRTELLELLRRRAARGEPLNARWVEGEHHGIWHAARTLFGNYRRALLAAGLDPEEIYLSKRNDEGDLRRFFARARRVAAIRGDRRRLRELDRLHRERGSFVQQRFGGWSALARQLGIAPRLLVKRRGWDRAAVVEALRVRARAGETLAPGVIHHEDKGLYVAVIRFFGTFEECYEGLGFPPPDVGRVYQAAWRDPAVLLEKIRSACRAAPASGVITGTDMLRYTKLAWLARRHFGSWDEGLRRATRGTGIEVSDIVRYADPGTLDADLKRLAEGKLRAGPERRRVLFRYAERLRGGVVDALESAGASRQRALRVEASPWPDYPTGRSVLDAIENRRREGVGVTFRSARSGTWNDRHLVQAAKFLFASWDDAVAASGEE